MLIEPWLSTTILVIGFLGILASWSALKTRPPVMNPSAIVILAALCASLVLAVVGVSELGGAFVLATESWMGYRQ